MKNKHLFLVSVGSFIGWSLSTLYNGVLHNILLPNSNSIHYSTVLFIFPIIIFLIIQKKGYPKYSNKLYPISISICFVGYLYFVFNFFTGSLLENKILTYLIISIIGIGMLSFISYVIIIHRYLFDFNNTMFFIAQIILISYGICLITWFLLFFKLVLLAIIFSIIVLLVSLVSSIKLSNIINPLWTSQNYSSTSSSNKSTEIKPFLFFLLVFLFNLGDGIILALLEKLHFNQNYYRIFFTIVPYVVIPIIFITMFKKINNSQLWVSIGAGLLIIGFILYNFSSSAIIISVLGMIILDIILWGIGLMLNIVYKRSFVLVACAIGSNSLATFIGYISTISYYKNITAMSVCFAISSIAAVIGILLIPTLYNNIVSKCVKNYEKHLSIKQDRKKLEQIAKSYSLTNKEIDIFILLLNEYRYNKIATEMNISLNTVKTHIKHIYSKLDVSSKKELLSKISNVY